MNNFNFLKKYQELQSGVMFNRFIDLGFARIGFCEIDKTTFWNWALTDQLLTREKIQRIEQEMEDLSRQTTIYFENKPQLEQLTKLLLEKGYFKGYEDSWMFYQGGKINESRFDQVKKVTNEADLKVFLEIFDKCYQEDDPQNPYGALGGYLKVAEKSWHEHHQTDRIEYFITFKDSDPVAVATLNNFEGIGYISNVGSLKEVRGEGFGKLVTLYCVAASQKHGNTIHCLATEEGTYPNEFYQRIGFKALFTAIGYTSSVGTK